MSFYVVSRANSTDTSSVQNLMMSFLFWNMKKLPRAEEVAQMARHYNVDVLILAECEIPDDETLSALKIGDRTRLLQAME